MMGSHNIHALLHGFIGHFFILTENQASVSSIQCYHQAVESFYAQFSELLKATISFEMSVCLSTRNKSATLGGFL
jgi:thermostable 8-oxoguanine DNA glycosylase